MQESGLPSHFACCYWSGQPCKNGTFVLTHILRLTSNFRQLVVWNPIIDNSDSNSSGFDRQLQLNQLQDEDRVNDCNFY